MNIHLGLAPLISLLAGILIFIVPRLLNYIVAVYLIVIGLIGLSGAGQGALRRHLGRRPPVGLGSPLLDGFDRNP